MDGQIDPEEARAPGTPNQAEPAEALEAYVARLLADRAGEIPDGLDLEELRAYMLTGALAGARPQADSLPPAVRTRLDARLEAALASRGDGARAQTAGRLTRRRGLAFAGAMAASVLVGVAADHELAALGQPPHKDLVGDGRWYNVAAAIALPVGAVRRFSAGGIDGYLLNEGGQVRALSAICTHMGCHLNWSAGHDRFECLCHASAFNRQGQVVAGGPWASLPPIIARVEGDRIYVWGTRAISWGTPI